MCGFYFSNNINKLDFKSNLERINHRGPDHTGLHFEDDFCFGHKRLSIIDLEARSNQPFVKNNYVLLFNGEIYNYKEIKKNLQKSGYVFDTESDTEVLLLAYDYYKEKLPSLLNGMFAFLIYDKEQGTLFGARDRTGQKPLFYKKRNNLIEFSSELSPLIKKDSSLNNNALGYYLLYGIAPNDTSLIDEVFKVKPAHYFEYSFKEDSISFTEYWNNNNDIVRESDNYEKEFSEIFADATQKRLLESDVETAVFLSGGIDSTIVTKFGVKGGLNVSTLSVAFDEDKYDESKHAELVAETYNTNHKTISCSINEVKDFISNIGDYLDEPMGDSSFLAELLISKVARDNGIKVVLTGDGADEYFLGYKRYLWVEKIFKLKNLGLHKVFSKKMLPKKYQRYFESLLLDKNEIYGFLISGLDYKTYINIAEKVVSYTNVQMEDTFDCANVDKENYLVNDINIKVDRGTMAFSIESRSPFLDYRVIDFANCLPKKLKYNGKIQKVLLKNILEEDFKKDFIYRSKQGFGVPLGKWMQELFFDDIKNTINCNYLIIEEFFERAYLDTLLYDLKSGNFDTHHVLWRLFVLCKWHEKYIIK